MMDLSSVNITVEDGGVACYDHTIPVEQTWKFDRGEKKGVATITIRHKPCTEEERKANRQNQQDALWAMKQSAPPLTPEEAKAVDKEMNEWLDRLSEMVGRDMRLLQPA